MMRPLTPIKENAEHKIATLESSELQAILNQQVDAEICLLRDSPFRILRVSRRNWECGIVLQVLQLMK